MSAELCSLEQTLAQSIGGNKARIKFLARFLLALIAVKTVCLTQIASVFAGKVKPASHYKRVQRSPRSFEPVDLFLFGKRWLTIALRLLDKFYYR